MKKEKKMSPWESTVVVIKQLLHFVYKEKDKEDQDLIDCVSRILSLFNMMYPNSNLAALFKVELISYYGFFLYLLPFPSSVAIKKMQCFTKITSKS